MIKYLLGLLLDDFGGLGLTYGSIMSSVLDDTDDDSADAQTKVGRLINRLGPQFCAITNWPFLRDDISFTIQESDNAYKYSGAGYLPATFKRVVAARLVDSNNEVYPLTEVSLTEAYRWTLPSEDTGQPDEFVITRIESGFWEIWFNRQPDDTYTIEFEIEKQWVAVSASADETVVTLEFEGAFVHYVSMGRLRQQGDLDTYLAYKSEWWNRADPKGTVLFQALSLLAKPAQKKSGMIMQEGAMMPEGIHMGSDDYNTKGSQAWA